MLSHNGRRLPHLALAVLTDDYSQVALRRIAAANANSHWSHAAAAGAHAPVAVSAREYGMGTTFGMAHTAQQECFGDAFLQAIASVAGCATSMRRPDDDSIDWTLSCRLPFRPKLDVQMKTWTGDDGAGNAMRYLLKRKNCDDLRVTDVLVPRILVLVTLAKEIKDWTDLSPERLVLRRCAYWASLAGELPSENETSVTVSVSRANVLTVEALQRLMQRINDGDSL